MMDSGRYGELVVAWHRLRAVQDSCDYLRKRIRDKVLDGPGRVDCLRIINDHRNRASIQLAEVRQELFAMSEKGENNA